MLPVSPLLFTESEDEFNRIRDGLKWELMPRGAMEEILVEDIAHLTWDPPSDLANEAEAVKTSAADLERFDRMLASLESRRNKALRCLAEYRGGLAQQLRESGDRIIDGKVLVLEHASSKKPPAAA